MFQTYTQGNLCFLYIFFQSPPLEFSLVFPIFLVFHSLDVFHYFDMFALARFLFLSYFFIFFMFMVFFYFPLILSLCFLLLIFISFAQSVSLCSLTLIFSSPFGVEPPSIPAFYAFPNLELPELSMLALTLCSLANLAVWLFFFVYNKWIR